MATAFVWWLLSSKAQKVISDLLPFPKQRSQCQGCGCGSVLPGEALTFKAEQKGGSSWL